MSEERTGPEPGEPDDLEPEDLGEDLDPDLVDPDPDDIDPEPEPEPEPEPPPRSRSRERITRQQERLRVLEEQNRRLTEALTRHPAQPQYQPQPDPARQADLDRQEFERVSQMPFEEQSRYWARKTEERVQQQINLQSLQTRDMLDQNNFRQIMREKRLPAKYANEVETLLSQARQQGMNPTREMVLQTVIGREVLDRKDRETEKQRARGQRRIASQTVRPGGVRSTAAVPGGRRGQNQDAEDEAFLKSITWGEVNR